MLTLIDIHVDFLDSSKSWSGNQTTRPPLLFRVNTPRGLTLQPHRTLTILSVKGA